MWFALINSVPLSSIPFVMPITSSVITRCFQKISWNPVLILMWNVGRVFENSTLVSVSRSAVDASVGVAVDAGAAVVRSKF